MIENIGAGIFVSAPSTLRSFPAMRNGISSFSAIKRWLATAVVVYATFVTVAGAEHISKANANEGLVLVEGGTFKNTNSNYYGKSVSVSEFYIGKYLVTQKEWTAIMGNNPSKFKDDRFPVETVSWYDSIDYCNKRSLREGLKLYYSIDKSRKDPNNKPNPRFGDLDSIKWTVTIHPEANGYRLPTEAEWEYAASGGNLSLNYTYSGGDLVDDVAWYWRNSGDRRLSGFWNWPEIQQNHDQTKIVGSKPPNELGLYDMSGDVREWCWDWYGELSSNVKDPTGSQSGFSRVWRGGGWMGAAYCTSISFRGSLAANARGPDQGFRLCRNP